jgi:predicted transcriptional regulator
MKKALRAKVATILAEVFEELPLTKKLRADLQRLAFEPLLRTMRRGASGIVIAGFGREQHLPCLQAFEIEGIVLDQPIYASSGGTTITTGANESAAVNGFAQSDVIHMFMEGVAPDYQEFVDSYIDVVITRFAEALTDQVKNRGFRRRLEGARDELRKEFAHELWNQRYNNYIEPVLDVVQSLPIDELAALAESLVNLTSLKRKISRDDETVGGPVDVAVISKGDGLIWVRRKHYFEHALNPQFFANYYRGAYDGESAEAEGRAEGI